MSKIIVAVILSCIVGLIAYMTWARNKLIFIEMGVACIQDLDKEGRSRSVVIFCNCVTRGVLYNSNFLEKMYYTATLQPNINLATTYKKNIAKEECKKDSNSHLLDWD